jgi:hypothetical protein
VPQDAIVYVGWAGSESMGPGFDGSHLKAVLDASQLRQVIDEALPRLLERAGGAGERAGAMAGMLTAIGGPMWRHPTAIYLGGMDLANPDMPMPKFAVLCDAGKDGKGMADRVRKLMDQAGNFPIPYRVEEQDGLDAFVLGNVEIAAAKRPVNPLSGRKEFKAAMGQLGKDPVAVLYYDAEGQVDQVDQMVKQFAPPEAQQKWPIVRDALGLTSVKRIALSGGFDGKEWATQALFASPEPRGGLIKALVDAKPLSEDALRLIPKGATSAAAGHFDAGGLLAAIRDATKKIDPQASQQLDQVMEQFFQAVGLDVQADILDTLGDEWAVYSDPSVGGNGLLGLTVVNRLKNPAKAEKALGQLEQVFNAAMKQQTARDKVTVAFGTSKQGDLTIHYLSVPVVAPSWAVKDGNLYLGLYPQVVSGAAEHVTSKGASILENTAFVAVQKRLAATGATSVSFGDLPRTAADGYQEVLMLGRVYLGVADLFGARTPAMALPPLAKLMPHVTPAGGVAWVDKDGWHSRAVEPFPGSALLSGGLGSTMMMTQQAAFFLGFAAQREASVRHEVARPAEIEEAPRVRPQQQRIEPKGNK